LPQLAGRWRGPEAAAEIRELILTTRRHRLLRAAADDPIRLQLPQLLAQHFMGPVGNGGLEVAETPPASCSAATHHGFPFAVDDAQATSTGQTELSADVSFMALGYFWCVSAGEKCSKKIYTRNRTESQQGIYRDSRYIRYAIPETQAADFERSYSQAGTSLAASAHCLGYELPAAWTIQAAIS